MMEKPENNQESLANIKITTERLMLKPISLECKEDIFTEFTSEVTIFMDSRPKESKEFLSCAGLHHIDHKNPELGAW